MKRGGDFEFVSLDQQMAEAFYDARTAGDSTAESLFDVRWAKTLTSGALNSLRRELHAEGKSELFEQVKSFLMGGSALLSYDEASTRAGVKRRKIQNTATMSRKGSGNVVPRVRSAVCEVRTILRQSPS